MKILALGDSLTEGYIDNHTSKFLSVHHHISNPVKDGG